MQHQYWVTKKSVQRKLGGKEDECVISSDAELDAKLELFKSINESCVQLQRFINLYQERLCYLAQEEHTLGRYLKECGKSEKNDNAGKIMITAGKSLAYVGHQRLTIRPPLVRLHHEVDTFRGRAVTDTKVTVTEMEKCRTEYRAALSWMKAASQQLDPDTGHGVDKFRKAQSYVRSTKNKFDKFTLACLQKVDLLAAARCNMFSHALVPYVKSLSAFSCKAAEVLTTASTNLDKVEPYNFHITAELAIPSDEKDKETFFNAEYADEKEEPNKSAPQKEAENNSGTPQRDVVNLLGDDFPPLQESPIKDFKQLNNIDSTKSLLDLPSTENNLDDLSKDFFMPSNLIQGGFNFTSDDLSKLERTTNNSQKDRKPADKERADSQVSWLSLFDELDPLSNKNLQNQNGDQL
ncbi:hypothetical protein WA026_016465 [Henosepilachna vigintioctopunctata]|uniref:AH domain-containing protein n=1 Tax=Henosepilachna vigintioctopunctata TaxID=420089 RepID=A0AAW1UKH0_9CUCU